MTRRAISVVVSLLGLSLVAQAGPFDTWAWRMKVSFTGYNKPETLTNFPALIVLSNGVGGSAFAYSNVTSATGGDLRFASSNEMTELNYEIEKWDTNGASYVWVQVPTLAGTNDFVYAYWGKTTTAPAYTTNGATWSNAFKAVWHLASTNGTSVLDSSTNRYNGTTYNMPAQPWTNAAVGNGLAFDGVNDYVTGMGTSAGIVPAGGANYSVSLWFSRTATDGNREMLAQWVSGNSFFFGFSGSNIRFSDNWNSVDVGLGTDTNWHHLVAVSTPNNAYLYLDGVLKATKGSALTYTGLTDLYFGRQGTFSGGAEWYKGTLDEVQISTVARSSNWIWASYMNQASNSAFLGYGAALNSTNLSVAALAASGLGKTNATLNGQIGRVGGAGAENPAVYFCWGYTNSGTASTGNWPNVIYMGTNWGVGASFSTNIAGLIAGSNYTYQCYATNATGEAWSAQPATFATLVFPFDSWAWRMKVSFTNYTKPETLANFPALIVLNTGIANFSYSGFRSSVGADLRFADSTQTQALNYEIEKWDTNGASYVWVQVPSLAGTNDFIYAYWGKNTNAPACTTNGATWSNNYAAVWHLGEPLTAGQTTGTNYDSSANTNHGAQMRNGWANGKIGRAQDFVTASSCSINCGNKASLRPANLTISAWIYPRTLTAQYQEIYRKEDGNDRHLFSFQDTATVLSFGIGPGSFYAELDVGISAANYTGNWHHVVASYNGSVKKVYRDGVEIGSAAASGNLSASGTANGYIGSYLGTGEFFDGLIDEVEISGVGRSSNWVWACYMNQASNTAFLGYGGVEVQAPVLTVTAAAASGLGKTNATLNGQLGQIGGAENPKVYFCLGYTNCGTASTGNWPNVIYMGTNWGTNASFSTNIAGLISGSNYTYQCYATNSTGEAWSAQPATFATLAFPFESWAWRMKVSFTNYTRPETLANFPVLVVLNTGIPNFSYNGFQSSVGADLRFADSTQTRALNYEIEKWDATGSSYVWVQVPSLAGTNDCIYAYWGKNTNAPPCATNGATWSNNYAAVWHLGEASGPVADASGNGNTGTVSATYVARGASGRIDGAYSFYGNPGNLDCGTGATLNVGYASWEAWVFPTNLSSWNCILDKGYNNAYWFGLVQYTGAIRLHCGGGSGNAPLHDSTGTVPANQWSHIVSTWDGTTVRHYINGLAAGSNAETGGARTNATKVTHIGAYFNDGTGASSTLSPYNYYGYLDEVRMSGMPRSSNWVWACYMNQASNSAFQGYGGVEVQAPVLAVTAAAASGLGKTNATLNGQLGQIGGAENPAVYFCWGYTNSGTASTGNWPNVIDMGTNWGTNASFSTNIAGLISGSNYTYQCYATNSTGEAWSFQPVGFLTPTLPYETWHHRVKIAFTNYSRSGTLTNFPALITLGTNISGFSYRDFGSDSGADLRFENSTSTAELNYEIEKWDTNGASLVWVQIPALAGANDFIYAYWGKNTNAPPCTTNGATWSSGFKGVWHLAGTNGATAVADSSSNRYHGTTYNMPAQPWTNAAIGNGLAFDGVNDYVTGMGYGLVPAGGSNYSVSVWFSRTSTSGYREMLSQWYYGANDFFLGFDGNNVRFSDNWNPVNVGLGTDSNWHHLVAVSTANNAYLYVDGVLKATRGSALTYTGIRDLYFGRQGTYSGGAEWYQGTLDEVEISSVARSADWIWAAYMNQASGGGFLGYGAAELASSNLGVAANAASGIGPTNAMLNGRVLGVGGAGNPSVYFCWGYTNSGTVSTGDWSNVIYMGTNWGANTAFTTNIGGLLSGSNYTYQCYVTNGAGSAWSSDPRTFTTIFLPAVTNLGAADVRQNAALLRGQVTQTGGDTPLCWFCYWTNGAASTSTVAVGAQSGAFSNQRNDLSAGSDYRYQILASNAAGASWSTVGAFTTMLASAVFTNVWTGAADSNWFNAANWSAAETPVPGDYVLITNTGRGVLLTNTTALLGSLVISNQTLIFSGAATALRASNVVVRNAGTMTHVPMSATQLDVTNRVYLICQDLTVEAGGKIDVSQKGYPNRYGFDGTNFYAGVMFNGTSAGHGGRGGWTGKAAYDSPSAPIMPGSAGGRNSGSGGGVIRIEAGGAVVVNGTLNAGGGGGGDRADLDGGCSGGSIYLTCYSLSGSTSGVIKADGGGSDYAPTFAGGAGGRIALIYTNADISSIAISADFGKGTVENSYPWWMDTWAEPGTIYLSSPTQALSSPIRNFRGVLAGPAGSPLTAWTFGDLVLSNSLVGFPSNFTARADSIASVTNGRLWFRDGGALRVTNDLALNGRGLLFGRSNVTFFVGRDCIVSSSSMGMDGRGTLTVGRNLIMTNNAALSVVSGSTNGLSTSYGSKVDVTGNVVLGSNSWVYPRSYLRSDGGGVYFKAGALAVLSGCGFNGDAAGFPATYGPGSSAWIWSNFGGTHGGRGGGNTNSFYGVAAAPVIAGSGSSRPDVGGSGGGAFAIEAAGECLMNGTLKANGGAGQATWGGGSGGAIFLVCGGNFSGNANALIEARGGPGSSGAGAGGGGRVAIWHRTPPARVATLLAQNKTNTWVVTASIPSYLGSASVTNGLYDGYAASTTNATPGTFVFIRDVQRGTVLSLR